MVAATQKPAKKPTRPARKSIVGVKTKSGFVLGYARDLIQVRAGVDLTKPTYVLGK